MHSEYTEYITQTKYGEYTLFVGQTVNNKKIMYITKTMYIEYTM